MDVVKSVVTLKDIRGQMVRSLPFRLQGSGYKSRLHTDYDNILLLYPITRGHEASARPKIQGERTGEASAHLELGHEASCQGTQDRTGAE